MRALAWRVNAAFARWTGALGRVLSWGAWVDKGCAVSGLINLLEVNHKLRGVVLHATQRKRRRKGEDATGEEGGHSGA